MSESTTAMIHCKGCDEPFYYLHKEMTENPTCPFCGYGHLVTRVQHQDWDSFRHEYYPGHWEYRVQG